MAKWEQSNIVLTTVGRTLLSNAQLGKGRIKITRVLARENFETAVSTLRAYTLSDIPQSSISQEGHILNTQVVNHPEQEVETSLLTVRFSNDELADKTMTYNLRQVIVMARLVDINSDENLPHADDLGEVPYMVAQCSDRDEPDLMPPRESNPTSLDYDIYVVHSGVPTITVELRTSGFVFNDVYNADKTEIWVSINEIKENAVGQNTKDQSFTTWTPVYSKNNTVWSTETLEENVKGQKSAERFNNYGNNSANIAVGSNSSAFGVNTEVLGSQSVAFGYSNFVGNSASNSAVFGTQCSVRSGANNFVAGLNVDLVSGENNLAVGTTHSLKETNNSFITGTGNKSNKIRDTVLGGIYSEAYGTIGSIVGGYSSKVGDSENPQWNTSIGSIVWGMSLNVSRATGSLIVGNDIEVEGALDDSVILGSTLSTESSIYIVGKTVIATGSCINSVVVGTSHEIHDTQSAFVSGNGNTVNASFAATVMGYKNTANSSARSFITGESNTSNSGIRTFMTGNSNVANVSNDSVVCGAGNDVTSSNLSAVFGNNHSVYSSPNVLVFGAVNTVSPNNDHSMIGGSNNRTSHSQRSIICGTGANTDYANDSAVVGRNNRIYGQKQNNSNIIGGNSNIVHNDGGLGNYDVGKTLVVGTNNDVSDYSDSVLSGSDNTLQNIMESSVTGRYINVYYYSSQPRSIGVRYCDISGSNINITQFETSVITGKNHNLTDYKPTGVAGEWNINSCSSVISGETHNISGIYSSVVTGFSNTVKNIHDSIISGRSNIVDGKSTPSGGYTNSVIVVGKSNTVNNNYTAQAVFGSDNTVNGGNNLTSGNNLINSGSSATVLGRYNVEDTSSEYAVIVGGGSSAERRNIAALDWSGGLHLRSIYTTSIFNPDGTPFDFGGGSNYIRQGTGFYSLILNDIENNRASGQYATSLGYSNNVGGDNSIAAGSNNTVSGNNSCIVGRDNEISNDGSYSENLVTGRSNRILNSTNSILIGYQHHVSQGTDVLVSGRANRVSTATEGFVTGQSNRLDFNDYSAIVGGYDNSIVGDTTTGNTSHIQYSVIIGGNNNRIHKDDYQGTSTRPQVGSVILGGNSLRVPNDYCVVMGHLNAYEGITDAALIIGNGSSSNVGGTVNTERHNAVVIDTKGNIKCGDDDKSLNERIAELETAVAELQGRIKSIDIYQRATMPDDTTGLLTIGKVMSKTPEVTNIIGELCVDEESSLPTPDTFTGYHLEQGSIALLVNKGEFHVLTEDNEWVVQEM